MKKNIFLIFLSILISACYFPPDMLETPVKLKDPFKKNPYTDLPLLPPGFGPSRGPSIAPRDGKYPANYFKTPPSSYNSFNF
jgi:hypothetical protein